MTIDFHVNDLELAWILLTLVGTVFASACLADAVADQRAVKALNGRARELIGKGNVRREGVRLGLQVYMLVLAVPALFDDRQVTMGLGGIMFILGIPVGLAVNSALDLRERRILSGMSRETIQQERVEQERRRSG